MKTELMIMKYKNPSGVIKSMKTTVKILVLFFLIFNSCKKETSNNNANVEVDLNTIPKEWTELSEHNEEKVILQPCDSDTAMYIIFKSETGWQFQYSGGHDVFDFDIKNVRLDDKHLKFSLEDPRSSEITAHATIMNYSSQMKTAQVKFNDFIAEFVNENGVKEYEKYIQPCKECWDDCPLINDLNSSK